jgi:hypothetical protein
MFSLFPDGAPRLAAPTSLSYKAYEGLEEEKKKKKRKDTLLFLNGL